MFCTSNVLGKFQMKIYLIFEEALSVVSLKSFIALVPDVRLAQTVRDEARQKSWADVWGQESG